MLLAHALFCYPEKTLHHKKLKNGSEPMARDSQPGLPDSSAYNPDSGSCVCKITFCGPQIKVGLKLSIISFPLSEIMALISDHIT